MTIKVDLHTQMHFFAPGPDCGLGVAYHQQPEEPQKRQPPAHSYLRKLEPDWGKLSTQLRAKEEEEELEVDWEDWTARWMDVWCVWEMPLTIPLD